MRQVEQSSTSRFIGYGIVIAAAILFGINGSLSRLLFNNGVTPVTLVEFRMIVGFVCLFGFLLIGRRQELKMPRRAWGWLLIFGLTMALVTYTYFVAISRIPIAVTLVIQFNRLLLIGGMFS